jgi:N-acyl-D-aspartate/D-glutamate deacylase
MANFTAEQIEQKKQLLEEKMKEMKAIYDELLEAGAIELSDDDLDKATGGCDTQSQPPLNEYGSVNDNNKPKTGFNFFDPNEQYKHG